MVKFAAPKAPLKNSLSKMLQKGKKWYIGQFLWRQTRREKLWICPHVKCWPEGEGCSLPSSWKILDMPSPHRQFELRGSAPITYTYKGRG